MVMETVNWVRRGGVIEKIWEWAAFESWFVDGTLGSHSECVGAVALWVWDFAEGRAAGRGHSTEDTVSRHSGDWSADRKLA